jgi:hypothetical protein
MHWINLRRMRLAFIPAITLLILSIGARAQSATNLDFLATDYSAIHGVNFCAPEGHHLEHWLHYNAKDEERYLDYAKKINVNQIRVFLSRAAYETNKAAFRQNLQHLARVPGAGHRADAGG